MSSNNDRATDSETDSGTESERIGGEPIDGDGSYPFAGLSRWTDREDIDAVTLPVNVERDTSSMAYWARNKTGHSFEDEAGVDRDLDPDILPERGLMTLIQDLPRANHAEAAWVHPRTGEVLKTAKHNAVINPARTEGIASDYGTYAEAISDIASRDQTEVAEALDSMSLADYKDQHLTEMQAEILEDTTVGDDALFQIAGEDHSIINPQQPLEELALELDERDFGDKIFGEVTIDRDGGRASLDIYIDGQHVESPVFDEDREPVVVGLQVQWSFFDDWAFRVCGQGLDWACTNHIHRMTNREVVKYAGDVEGRTDWRDLFSDVLDSLDEKRDQLARVIEAASNEVLDFSDLPADIGSEFEDEPAPPWTALYSYLGLPDYLAREAGQRLQQRAEDAYSPNWWEVHSAATFAVSHHDRGSRNAGGSFEDHARTANDMLFNPAAMEDRLVDNYEADRVEDDQVTLAEEGGGTAEIRSAFDSARERKERFEEWEEELVEMGVDI